MKTDIRTATLTSTGTAYADRTRVRYLAFVTGGTAGSIKIRDGGGSGDLLIDLATPATTDFYETVLPEAGVVFETDVHVTLSNVTSITVGFG